MKTNGHLYAVDGKGTVAGCFQLRSENDSEPFNSVSRSQSVRNIHLCTQTYEKKLIRAQFGNSKDM